MIAASQKDLLIALSQDPDTPPFSKEFQLRQKIGHAPSINASLASLVKKGGLIKKGPGAHYPFFDVLFSYWIEDLGNCVEAANYSLRHLDFV